MKLRSLFVAVVALVVISMSRAAIEFTGYIASKDGAQFVLTDLESGAKSRWLMIGDAFLGHVLARFDPDRETLVLERGGAFTPLRLKDSRVQDGKPTAPPRTEVKVLISREGSFTLGDKPADLAAIESYFRAAAENGRHLSLAIHEPPEPTYATHQYTKKVMAALAASGAKKWSIKIVNAAARE